MKKLIMLFTACALALATFSCVKYDDTELKNEISDLGSRVSTLESQMKDANSNISSLLELVNAIKGKVMVSSVTETVDAWTIRFDNGKTVTISKVHSPVVGVKQDSDGIYYWTLDGEWLLDGKGNKMPVSGKDGISPQLKIQDGFWMISTDGGATWAKLEKASGEDGDTFFSDVKDDGLYVYLTLADGSVLKLVKSDVMDILKRIQSIQYVPDYDDGKITVNSALVTYGTDAVLYDQPTDITYQILPAQYAVSVAKSIKAIYDSWSDRTGPDIRSLLEDQGIKGLVAWFDVRKVNTRSGSGEGDVQYGMKILEVNAPDDGSGEITFKVLPVNIASESFVAGGLKPRYDIGITASNGSYIQGWNPDDWMEASGVFRAEDPLYPERTFSFPVWTLTDLQAWQGRSAFAVQLHLYQLQDYEEAARYENELASPFTTLYPNVLEPIELLPGAYKPGPDDTPVAISGAEETQTLPYDVLRENGTSEEPGYRVILNGLTPAFEIDGKTVSAKEAYDLGYMVYGMTLEWDRFTYSSHAAKDFTVGTGQVYAEVEMNPYSSEEERHSAIGGKVTGHYNLITPFGTHEYKGTVVITDSAGPSGSGPDDPGTGPDVPGPGARYDFMHLKYYTFNTKRSGETMQKLDFDDNDGSVEWFTRCNPAYYTSLPYYVGGGPHYDTRISFRHALAEYSPSPLNFAELAFNVVDENDNIMDEKALSDAGLEVKFEFTDPSLGARTVPILGMKYSDLWTDNTTFSYISNEMPFIRVKGRLFKNTDSGQTELPTRFTAPRASVNYPSEMLDYSTFAIVPWVPFDNLEGDDFRVDLDEHKVYRIPLGHFLELQDIRPGGVSYRVIEDGKWVIGNVTNFDAGAGTYLSSDGSAPNGFIDGICSKDAYRLGDLVFDIDAIKAAFPAELRRLVSIKYSTNGLDFLDDPTDESVAYLSFDYTSGIEFHGTIAIPVHVELPNPWQPTLETDYTIYIVGNDSSSGTGTTKTADDWVGTWSVLSGDGSSPAASYDTWTIRKTPDGTLLIYGVTGFTDSEHAVSATVNADGDLIIGVQYTGVASDDKLGELRLLLSGQYTNVEGNTLYSITEGTPILIGHLSDDGESAYLDPQEVTSAGAPASFYNIRFFGRYQKATGGWSAVIWIGFLSRLPQTITRVK